MGQGAELYRSGIDERVGPGKLQLVDAFSKCEVPRLLDQRQVGGVVDGELHRVAVRERDDVDAGVGGVGEEDAQSQNY